MTFPKHRHHREQIVRKLISMPRVELPSPKPGESNVTIWQFRSLVIVGANGTGKSKLGVFIENAAEEKGHRISAQRALKIPESVQPRPYDVAEATLRFGQYDANRRSNQLVVSRLGSRWEHE